MSTATVPREMSFRKRIVYNIAKIQPLHKHSHTHTPPHLIIMHTAVQFYFEERLNDLTNVNMMRMGER